jgi:nicotinamidase-related amidase
LLEENDNNLMPSDTELIQIKEISHMANQLTLDRCKTAVLIMDYQNRMLNELSEAARKDILRKANEILSKARSVSIPVIYIEVRRGERTPEMEIHPGVTPKPGELVLTKQRTFHHDKPE